MSELDELNEQVDDVGQKLENPLELKIKTPEPGFLDGLLEKLEMAKSGLKNMFYGSEEASRGVSSLSGSLSASFEPMEKTLTNVKKEVKLIKEQVLEAKKSIGSDSDGTASGLSSHLKHMMESAKKMVGPGTAIAAQTTMKSGFQKVDDTTGVFSKVQKPVMDIQKAAMQMQLAMGKSFDSAIKNVGAFRNEFTNAMVDTKSTMEDVTKTQAAFRDVFSADDAVRRLVSLEKATKDVRASTTLTTTALLVGAAKGVDSAKIAEMMSKAHFELGATAEEAAESMGDIALASEKSGLSFSKSAGAIMDNASKLAMWGGTIKTVAPLLQAFTSALGDNRKGLAPKLLEEYVGGLERMGFEMRALTGISTGVGGGKGAIGAGLEMEALLDKGAEGMAEVSQRLIDTIKQFSGGEIITREQAIADPALEQNFLIQRKLLQQMTNSSDSSATRMIGILKNIDANGLDVGDPSDALSELQETMGQGQRVKDSTTDSLTAQVINLNATQIESGEKIVAELSTLVSLGQEMVSAGLYASERMAKTGTITTQDIRTTGKLAGAEKLTDKLVDAVTKSLGIGEAGGKREEVKTRLEVETGIKAGRENSRDITNVAVRELLVKSEKPNNLSDEQKQRLESTGEIPVKEFAEPILKKAIMELSKSITEVGGGQAREKLSNMKKAEIAVMEERMASLTDLLKQEYILPEQLGIKKQKQPLPKELNTTPVNTEQSRANTLPPKEPKTPEPTNTPSAAAAAQLINSQQPTTARGTVESGGALTAPRTTTADVRAVQASVSGNKSTTSEKITQDIVLNAKINPVGDGIFKFELSPEKLDATLKNSEELKRVVGAEVRREKLKND